MSASEPAELQQGMPQPGIPQQVVQRIAPTPAALNATAGSAPGAAPNGSSGPKDANERSARSAVETVTAQHVEAELNRLEAELK